MYSGCTRKDGFVRTLNTSLLKREKAAPLSTKIHSLFSDRPLPESSLVSCVCVCVCFWICVWCEMWNESKTTRSSRGSICEMWGDVYWKFCAFVCLACLRACVFFVLFVWWMISCGLVDVSIGVFFNPNLIVWYLYVCMWVNTSQIGRT